MRRSLYSDEAEVVAKTDVKSPFRIIPIHPADHPLLGIR